MNIYWGWLGDLKPVLDVLKIILAGVMVVFISVVTDNIFILIKGERHGKTK